ncbi:MAG: ribosome small subunit-dependent GTPase A, partial [Candidatus Eisenbacteria bacterium]|nr:ribosome small subunit-dependent GTPase A [Candidatus Eisenbacteria bacterium]
MESNRSKDAARENGLVLFRSGNHCEVLTADGESKLSCLCTGAAGEEIAVGDLVAVERDGAASGIIRSVEPRTNHLSRRAAGPRPVEQRIAANLDWGVAVFAAAEPKPHWGMLDRYLVQMETQSIPPLLCVTKSDLAAGVRSLEADLEPYRAAGLPVLLCSCETGEGIGELAALLRGRVSVLVGKSGVGKSTLIQKLTGLTGESLRTAEVSRRTGKGKHTTSEIRMLPLPDGGFVIDTPGAREFALWDVPREEIARGFPEMRSLLGTCRFGGGCTHSHEPDCAVKQAVREGEIDARRYRSYLRLIGRDGDAELPAGKHGADDERRAARGPAGRS